MNDQTWIFGKAISPLFADWVTIFEVYKAKRKDTNELYTIMIDGSPHADKQKHSTNSF